ncbi:MAG: hypothetical protein AB1762_01695 [Gemmatimonadota bacterium]
MRLRMAIPLPTTHLVKAVDGRVAPEFVTALDDADRTLLLVSSSTTSLRTAQRLLKFTAGIGVGADRVLVIAHDVRDGQVGMQELADVLDREIYWELAPDAASDGEQQKSYAGLAAKLGLRPDLNVRI